MKRQRGRFTIFLIKLITKFIMVDTRYSPTQGGVAERLAQTGLRSLNKTLYKLTWAGVQISLSARVWPLINSSID